MTKTSFALLAALAFAGCAGKYVAPSTGPTTVVKYVAGKGVVQGAVYTYDSEDCENIKLLGSIGSSSRGNVSTLFGREEPQSPEKSFVLPATGRLINHFRILQPAGVNITLSCSVTISFQPQPEQNYEVRLSYEGGSCYANVFRVTPLSPFLVLEPSARKTVQQCRF